MSIVLEPTWSISAAAREFDCRRETVADLAQRHRLFRQGKRIDCAGMMKLARLLGEDDFEIRLPTDD